MLAVAGLTFAYTSCTDYSKDIDENKSQIDAVSSELATAKQQIESLKTDVSNLQTAKAEAEKAISALQTSLKDLQTKHDADVKALEAEISKVKADYAKADEAVKADLQKKIDALTDALKTAEDNHAKELKTVNGLIEELQGSVKTINGQIETINKTLETLATKQELADVKTWAETTLATKDAVTEVITSVSVLSQTFEAAKKVLEQKDSTLTEDIKALNAKLTALEGQHASDVADLTTKIGEAKAAAAAAQATANEAKTAAAAAQSKADQAEEHAQKALGDIEALKNALGVYAENGKLAATIKALVNADSLAAVDVAKKYDELKALRLADSTWTATELAKKFNSSEFETEFGKYLTKAVEKDGIVNDSIAANIDRLRKEHESSLKALTTEVNTKFNALFSIAKQLKSLVFVPELYVDGIEATEYTYADYIKKAVQKGDKTTVVDEKGVSSIIPAVAANQPKWWNYQGSTAHQYINIAHEVTYKMNPSSAEVPENLAFVSYDKQVITKASEAIPVPAEFVSNTKGDLTVSMNPVGQKVAGRGKASIFALQATYKTENGADTTVTSDFANLYASTLTFNAVAFSKETYEAVDCSTSGLFNHLYTTAAAAIQHAPSVVVRYNDAEGLNLNDIVTTHITIDSKSAKVAAHADYAKKFPNNDYGISYKFELIDYTSGTYTTSESQHAFLKDGHIFVPCASTGGKADLTATGEKAVTAVGRRPLVRVTVQKGDDIILVGFIKFEITKHTDYVTADPFTDWTYNFQCNGDVKTTTWDQMVDNVIKHSGLTKEEFCNVYVLDTLANGDAVQYKVVSGKFESAATPEYFGKVEELKDAVPGTTTDVIRWTLFEQDLSAIYKLDGHKKTIWVRYIYKGTTPTSEYDGIYVPLTVKDVVKPVGSVSKKLENYWFGADLANAKINVARPKANGSTIPWETDINQVWEGNAPVFTLTPATGFADAAASYKYYFAPVQKTYTINGVKYVLSVDSNKVYDKYQNTTVGIEVKDNAKIQSLELNNALDITKGIYTNSSLYCKKGNEAAVVVAILDQTTGVITYQQEDVAKELLNAYESKPSKFEAAELFANIGVTAYSSCNTALSLSGAVNPYYFLRPINADGVEGKFFIDGKDDHVDESNINLFDLFDFVDWRGEKFVKAPGDYTNLWYFKYYNVKGITVDLDNVTTNLDGDDDDLETTKLSEKTTEIELSYRFGPRTEPTYNYTTTAQATVTVNIVAPAEPNWGVDHYNGLIEKFGYIHYNNNKSTVSKDFTIRVPVSFTYDWGVVKSHVDILVKHI